MAVSTGSRAAVRRIGWAVLIVLVLGAVWAVAARGATTHHPRGWRPAYVRPNGTLDYAKAPEWYRTAVPGRNVWGWITKAERWPTPPAPGALGPNKARPVYARPDTSAPVVGYLP